MVQDYLGLNPKGSVRIEWGGATGGECFQAAYEAVASGRMDVCLTAGFETMSRVPTWKGNEFIALASDTNYDFPLGGFYTGDYALMVVRHIYEYLRKTRFAHVKDEREAQRLAIAEGSRIMSLVSVKNHLNALHNPYAQYPKRLSVEDVLDSEMISYPMTREQICTMSDGAAVAVLCTEERAKEFTDRRPGHSASGPGRTRCVSRTGRSARSRSCRQREGEGLPRAFGTPASHRSARGGPQASRRTRWPGSPTRSRNSTSSSSTTPTRRARSETYEDLGLCRYGEGYEFAESGAPFLTASKYPFPVPRAGEIPVNPSGGLIACGHPVGATGLMQARLRVLAAAGHDRDAFRRRDAADPEGEARGDPQPRGHRIRGDRLDPRAGVLMMAETQGLHEVPRRPGRGRPHRSRRSSGTTDGVESLVIDYPYSIRYIHSYAEDSPFFLGLAEGRLGARVHGRCVPVRLRHAARALHGVRQPTEWIELPKKGRVHSWTTCHFGSEAFLKETPYNLALVEFEGAGSLLLARLKDCVETDIYVGMPVEATVRPEAQVLDHRRLVRAEK